MMVIMGASGHVGSAVVDALLERSHEVVAVTHDPKHAQRWKGKPVRVAVADLNHPPSLREAFRQGRRAFLLNPPAPVDTDTDQEELRTVDCILRSLEDTGLEKVVVESTGGARAGARIGDLNVLWTLEQGTQRLPLAVAINRAAYYMSNWDSQLEQIRQSGELTSFFPASFRLPMAAPRDLGEAAARRLLSGLDDTGIRYVEGPTRYSANDVAAAFAAALGKQVQVKVVAREQWAAEFMKLGFSPAAADSYARMTATTLDSLDLPDDPIRGSTTIDDYVRQLLARSS